MLRVPGLSHIPARLPSPSGIDADSQTRSNPAQQWEKRMRNSSRSEVDPFIVMDVMEAARQAEAAETAAQVDWLTTAMTALPEDLRDTLALVLDDMTHAQAGEILGVSEGTISWRVSQAKTHLRHIRQEEDRA